MDVTLNRSEELMAIINDGQVYDFSQIDFEASTFETNEKSWGTGKVTLEVQSGLED